MEVIKKIIQIRFFQAARIIKELGLGLGIFILPFAVITILGILDSASKNPFPIIPIGIILILFTLHINRNDFVFLKRLEIHAGFLFFVEYSILLLPFTIGLILLGSWRFSLLLQLAIIPICFLQSSPFTNSYWSDRLQLSMIPKEAFVWKSGIRKYWAYIIVLYPIGILLSKFTATVLLLTIVFALFSNSFFDELENKEIFEQLYFSEKHFLLEKVKLHSLVFNVAMLPLYLLFLVFNSTYWYLLLTVIFAAEMIILFAIIYKYAHFSPGRRRVLNSIPSGLFFGNILIPFLFPVGIFMILYYWKKANANLKRIYASD